MRYFYLIIFIFCQWLSRWALRWGLNLWLNLLFWRLYSQFSIIIRFIKWIKKLILFIVMSLPILIAQNLYKWFLYEFLLITIVWPLHFILCERNLNFWTFHKRLFIPWIDICSPIRATGICYFVYFFFSVWWRLSILRSKEIFQRVYSILMYFLLCTARTPATASFRYLYIIILIFSRWWYIALCMLPEHRLPGFIKQHWFLVLYWDLLLIFYYLLFIRTIYFLYLFLYFLLDYLLLYFNSLLILGGFCLFSLLFSHLLLLFFAFLR